MNPLEAIRAVYESDLGLFEQCVLLQLIDHMPDCRPSVERIAKRAKVSRNSVRRALASLRERGVVSVAEQPGAPNRYNIHLAQLRDPPQGGVPDRVTQIGLPHRVATPPLQGDHPSPPGSLSKQRSNQRSKQSRARARGWRTVPDSWEPNERHTQLARERGLDLSEQLARFRDFEFATPKRDADRAFANWLRRANDFAPRQAKARQVQQGMAPGITPQRWQPRRQAASGGSTG